MTDIFAEWAEKASRALHLTWCDHPMCLHVPFDEDRAAVRRILDLIRPEIDTLAKERDDLVGLASEWRGTVRRLENAMHLQLGDT